MFVLKLSIVCIQLCFQAIQNTAGTKSLKYFIQHI